MNDPLFDVGPMTAHVSVNKAYEQLLAQWLAAVKAAAGDNVSISYWPYRIGQTEYIAVHINGGGSELILTIVLAGRIRYRNELNSITPHCDLGVELVDSVDAFYFLERLFHALLPDASQADGEFLNLGIMTR